jgi:hypothetical protein
VAELQTYGPQDPNEEAKRLERVKALMGIPGGMDPDPSVHITPADLTAIAPKLDPGVERGADPAAHPAPSPYAQQAQVLNQKADALESNVHPYQPLSGWKGAAQAGIEGAVSGLLTGMGHPTPGFDQLEAGREATARTQNQDILGRVKDLRTEAQGQQTLGLTEEQRGIQNRQADMTEQRLQGEADYRKQLIGKDYLKAGYRLNSTTGLPEPVPTNELSEKVRGELDRDKAIKDLDASKQSLADAQTTVEKLKADPQSFINAEKMRQLDQAQERLGLLKQEHERKINVFNAQYMGQAPGGAPLAGVGFDQSGAPIGPAVANAGKAPNQLTVQSAAADRTKSMTSIVRGIVAQKPYLVGPIMGGMNELGQYVGNNPFQDPEDKKDAAVLAGHLAYLFANEVQGTMTNRPNPAIVKKLVAASAAMKDDPSILEGFLQSADNNANIALQTNQTYGVRKVGQTPPPKKDQPAAPAAGPVAADGTPIHMLNY